MASDYRVSRDYDEYLVEALSQPQAAALYLEAMLEEANPEPGLLPLALANVARALGPRMLTTGSLENQVCAIEEFLSQDTVGGIYNLAVWLDQIGLKLTITPKE
jgi:hypothetical protein